MKTLALISQKGGSGKTTLAVHLAVAAVLARKQTVIVDLDPQASALKWKDLRQSEAPIVTSAHAERLKNILDAAANTGADLAFIDTAPHSEAAALAAARHADLILVPCRPGFFDLTAIQTTIDLTRLAKASNVFVVLNGVPARGNLGHEAEEVINAYGVSLAPCQIGQRSGFVHAITTGRTVQEYEPGGKAADEINKAYKWASKLVG